MGRTQNTAGSTCYRQSGNSYDSKAAVRQIDFTKLASNIMTNPYTGAHGLNN